MYYEIPHKIAQQPFRGVVSVIHRAGNESTCIVFVYGEKERS